MTQQHRLVLAALTLTSVLLLPSQSQGKSASKATQKSSAPMAQTAPMVSGDPLTPGVLEYMRAAKQLAGPIGAIALPKRFAGKAIQGKGSLESREAYGPHYLSYTFPDGVHLDYYSDHGEDYNNVSAWEQLPSGDSISLYASEWMGDYPSSSLGYSESFRDEDAYKSKGRGIWDSAWYDSSGYHHEALVSEYESASGDNWWEYQGEDYAFRDWSNSYFSGGGSNLESGNGSNYYGDSYFETPNTANFGCYYFGESLYEYSDGYSSMADFRDECYQSQAPFHYFVVQSSTKYSWFASTGGTAYEYSGLLTCSDSDGHALAYDISYDDVDYSVKYADMDTGTLMDSPGCAWDPTGSL